MGAAHHTHAYRQARAALKAKRLQPCCLCGEPIDYTATKPDPLSFSAEHVIAARHGGDHTTLEPAHLGCQHEQGGHAAHEQAWASLPPIRRSGVW